MSSSSMLNAALTDYISVVNKVRDAGVSATIDLPTIVFCGKQSAGKSSLIESMSGVNLPRASGTCTRTPTEVRLTNTSPGTKWQCQIRLRYEEDDHKGDIEVPFGNAIYDKRDVAAAISRAQATLLGATGISSDVLNSGTGKMQFSRNVICVDIRGPECGDLALIDLPGLIETTEHPEDRVFIDVVRDMVLSYINKPNSIIAMTISCKDDMENQAIKTLAAEVDPMGHRTIGVLTKPDTIEAGCHDQYFDVLTGKRFPLRLGYFAVKNPNQKELNEGISRDRAKQSEREFFASAAPWCNVDSSLRNFGADNLTGKLGELLREKIKSEMPKMCSSVCAELQNVTNEISELDQGIDARTVHATLLGIICTFEQEVNACVEADNEAKDLFKCVLDNYKAFIATLQRERPVFAVSSEPPTEHLVEELTTMIVPIGSAGLTFEDVEDIVRSETGRHLVENMSYEPVRLLIKEFVKTWDSPAYHLIKEIRGAFESVIQQLAERRFCHYSSLMETVSKILITSLDKIEQEVSDRIRHLFDMENRMPFTMSAIHMAKLRKVNSEALWHHFMINRQRMMPDMDLGNIDEAVGWVNALGNAPTSLPDNEVPPGLENVDVASVREAIKVMAAVMAYFSIATKRFGDNVPMAIDSLFLRGFGSRVREDLCEQLGLFTKQPLELCELFVQDPESLRRKEELATKEERLKKAWDLLRPYASASQRSVNFSRPAVTKTSLEFPMDDNRTSRRNRYRDNSRARSMSPMPGGRQPHHDTNYSNGTSPQFGPQFGPGPQHGGPQFSNGLQFNPGQHGPQFGHQLGPNDTPLSSQTMRMPGRSRPRPPVPPRPINGSGSNSTMSNGSSGGKMRRDSSASTSMSRTLPPSSRMRH